MKPSMTINGVLAGLSFASFLLASLFGTATGKPLDDLAIEGYDTVAYFVAGKPVKGSEAFTYQWHDMTWYFSTAQNRDLFAAAPEKYAPQYDGFCAWAMTESRKAVTDPKVWKIVEGRLYLNCSRSAYDKWSRDIPGNIRKADENWRAFHGGGRQDAVPLR